jgi:diaminohydroxyphosphoribosylaminopyrimidine deaminase / 5-amino-6-(5-phosphoribosylamino)uracil reductase
MIIDKQHMRRALDLARAGVGLVSPNPAVGAVVVDASGHEVGTGTHTYAGMKHAEVLAFEMAGSRAAGGTLYLNLEPCSHQGRTGPCTNVVIAAGIKRVVCSMQDPNPKVVGQGLAKLRAAGITVEVGLFEPEAKKLNESFAKYIRRGKPLVTLKSAMTLDGKIADATKPGIEPGSIKPGSAPPASEGASRGYHWITGEIARAHVQQLRHQHDAIMAGVGTIMADDPLLTDRTGLPRRRKLLRVILDSYLRIPLSSRVIQTAEDDVLILCSTADQQPKEALEERGIRVQQMAATVEGRPDFPAIVRALGELEITSLLIEGGSLVNGAALASGEVDKVFLYYAPKLFGEGAVPFISGETLYGRAQCVQRFELHRFGEDFALEGYIHDPYAG